MRKVKIASQDGKTCLIVDDDKLSVGSLPFRLERRGGEKPEITITLSCDEVEMESAVKELIAPADEAAAE